MPALRKYPEELRERAIRLTLDARKDPASRPGACARIREQLGINPGTLRGWVTQAEIDAGARPGTSANDAEKLAQLERDNRVIGDTADQVSLSDVALSPTDRSTLLQLVPGGQPTTAHLFALADYRLRASRSQDGHINITGLPLQDVQSTVHRLQATELIVFAIALLLTGLGGAGWVILSLRPLRRVTMTAKQVTSLPLGSGAVDLSHRVPETDPRTEVGQLGAAFNQMLGHVETALEQREASEGRLRRFVADASHELRTPLAGIRSYAGLARRSTEPVPAEVSHALVRVESEAVRMGLLVNDLLLLARLDAGRPLEQKDVDLSRLTIEVTSDARVAGPDHRWSLDLPDEPLVVRGDEHRLHQVVGNLLSNARIHTPAGTSVVVRLSAEPRAGSQVLL